MVRIYIPHQYTIENKNNQTISTKCQYQILISKKTAPKVKYFLIKINVFKTKSPAPITTCLPWSPVNRKNHPPKIPSAIKTPAVLYSTAWTKTNPLPKKIVVTKKTPRPPPKNEKKWKKVIETLDLIKKTEFKRGRPNKETLLKNPGTHSMPKKKSPPKALFKPPQKKTKKKESFRKNKKSHPKLCTIRPK